MGWFDFGSGAELGCFWLIVGVLFAPIWLPLALLAYGLLEIREQFAYQDSYPLINSLVAMLAHSSLVLNLTFACVAFGLTRYDVTFSIVVGMIGEVASERMADTVRLQSRYLIALRLLRTGQAQELNEVSKIMAPYTILRIVNEAYTWRANQESRITFKYIWAQFVRILLPLVGILSLPMTFINAVTASRPALVMTATAFFTVDIVEWDVPMWVAAAVLGMLLGIIVLKPILELFYGDISKILYDALRCEREKDGQWYEQDDSVVKCLAEADIAERSDMMEREFMANRYEAFQMRSSKKIQLRLHKQAINAADLKQMYSVPLIKSRAIEVRVKDVESVVPPDLVHVSLRAVYNDGTKGFFNKLMVDLNDIYLRRKCNNQTMEDPAIFV